MFCDSAVDPMGASPSLPQYENPVPRSAYAASKLGQYGFTLLNSEKKDALSSDKLTGAAAPIAAPTGPTGPTGVEDVSFCDSELPAQWTKLDTSQKPEEVSVIYFDSTGLPRVKVTGTSSTKEAAAQVEFYTDKQACAKLEFLRVLSAFQRKTREADTKIAGEIMARRSDIWSSAAPFGIFAVSKVVHGRVRRACYGFWPDAQLGKTAEIFFLNQVLGAGAVAVRITMHEVTSKDVGEVPHVVNPFVEPLWFADAGPWWNQSHIHRKLAQKLKMHELGIRDPSLSSDA